MIGCCCTPDETIYPGWMLVGHFSSNKHGITRKKTEHRNSRLTSKCNPVPRTDYGTMKNDRPWDHDPDTGQSDSLFESTNTTEANGFI